MRRSTVSSLTLFAALMVGLAPMSAGSDTKLDVADHLRVELMNFADSFAGAINQNVTVLKATRDDPILRLNTSRNRVAGVGSLYKIAASEQLDHALLDMVVVTTLTRRMWQDYWQPEVYGDSAIGFMHELEQLDERIWRIVRGILTPEQLAELRTELDGWYEVNKHQRTAYHIRFSDLSEATHTEALAAARKPGGLFGLKGAASELEELRRTLERTLWLLPRAQSLAGLQAQNLLMAIMADPEMQTIIGATDSVASTGENLAEAASRVADSVDRLPADVAAERQAIFDALESAATRTALGDVRGIVDASNDLAAQIDATMHLVDTIMQRMPPPDPDAGRIGPAEIQALTVQLGATTAQLETLVVSIDEMMESSWWDERLPQLRDAFTHASNQGKRIIDHAIWRGSALIAIFMAMLLVTMLTYRFIARRFLGPIRIERTDIGRDEHR